MTITENRPTFPTKLRKGDVPDHCPGWCIGHDFAAENDPEHPFESLVEYERERARFRRHFSGEVFEYLSSLSIIIRGERPREIRPGGGLWRLQLRQDIGNEPAAWMEKVVEVTLGKEIGDETVIGLTSGEARTLAAQLIRFADLLDLDEI